MNIFIGQNEKYRLTVVQLEGLDCLLELFSTDNKAQG